MKNFTGKIKMRVFIIVPGLGGSRIYCDCNDTANHGKRMYPAKFLINHLDEHFFECEKTVTLPLMSFFGYSVYKKLHKRLQRSGAKVLFFSYDWRRPALENGKKLYNYLEDVVGGDLRDANIALVGHSLGGLILRIVIEYLKFPSQTFHKVFICGTPLIGSLNMFDYNSEIILADVLIRGSRRRLPRKPRLLCQSDVHRLIDRFRLALLYMVPSYEFGRMHGMQDVNIVDFDTVRIVHSVLGKFEFPGDRLYALFFNVSRRQQIDYKLPTGFVQRNAWMIARPETVNIHWQTNNEFNFQTQRDMDGTVLPCTVFPKNCIVIFDDNHMGHAFMLNSKYLANVLESL